MTPYEVLLEIRRQIRGSTTKSIKTDEIPVHVSQDNRPIFRDPRVELRIKDSNGKMFIVSVREA
jgi:hypothetical protein